MDIICEPRGSGKTTRLIKMAAERGGYIVCQSLKECCRIEDHARRLGLDIHQPISVAQLLERQYHARGIKEFYIDNAEMLFQCVTSVPVKAITLTQEDYHGST